MYKIFNHFHLNKFDNLDLVEQFREVTVIIHKPH